MALNTRVKGLQLNDSVFGLGLIRNAVDGNIMDMDFATIAGVGLAESAGVMSLDLNELSAEVVAELEDLVPFIDATDGSSKKVSVVDLVTAMAGTGLTAVDGKFTVDEILNNITEEDFVREFYTAVGGEGALASISSNGPVVENTVQVFLNGLLQEPGVGNDYTLDASTGIVTFLGVGASSIHEVLADGDIDSNWRGGAISDDGQVILVAKYSGVHLSIDGGETFALHEPAGVEVPGDPFGGTEVSWYKAAVSGDGQVLLVAGQGWELYISIDQGATWLERPIRVGGGDASAVLATNYDGSFMIAGGTGGGGGVYSSIDYGVTWNLIHSGDSSAGNMSRNGQYILLRDNAVGHQTSLSTNYGATFNYTGAGTYATGFASSDDGQTLMMTNGSGVHISINGGTSWSAAPGFSTAQTCAISSDGNTMLANYLHTQSGWAFISIDKGQNWTEILDDVGGHLGVGTALATIPDGTVSLLTEGNVAAGRVYLKEDVPASGGLVAGDLVAIHGLLDN